MRAGELRSLTPQSFDLSAKLATVAVAAAYSKRRRDDVLPLRGDLADLLRTWLADLPYDAGLFPTLPGNTARMLRSDLKAARAEWIAAARNDEERQARCKSDFLRY